METKKSRKADLEQRRTTWFLMGVVLVLATVYVALEYNAVPAADDGQATMPTLRQRDDVVVPMVPPQAIMQMLRPQETPPPPQPERLRVVESKSPDAPPSDIHRQQSGVADSAGLAMAAADSAALLPSQPAAPAAAQNPLNFRVVENLPQFPGGPVELMRWLTRHLRYPLGAQRQKIEGKVVVQFIVEADGSLSGLKIVEPLHPLCDGEALRVMRLMPQWQPGTQMGQPCRTMVCIPIVFRL